MANRTPEYLKSGDKVAIVASARKITASELVPALDVIKNWGLEPVLGPNVYSVDRQFAGTDEERAADLQWAMDDPEIKAIIFARGGYGTVRILDLLDFSKFVERPKWLAGFSDLTILFSHVLQNYQVESLHASMCSRFFQNTPRSLSTMKNTLFGELEQLEGGTESIVQGEASGVLMGGNLSMIYSSLGTTDQPDTQGAILFLEDLDEHLYHIDRMAIALKRAGIFEQVNGMILGSLTDMRDKTIEHGFGDDDPFGRKAQEILLEAIGRNDIPICSGFPVGHIADNCAMIIGRKIKMVVGKTTILNFV